MRHLALALSVAAFAAGCANGSDEAVSPTSAGGSTTTTAADATPPASGVLTAGDGGVTLLDAPAGAGVGRIRAGVLLPYTEHDGAFARVVTPCDRRAWVALEAGAAAGPFRVVIDPGHGGDEPGAVGPDGLEEAELNLDVAERVVAGLEDAGVAAVLTRSGDYRATLAFRVALTEAVGAEVFVSVHHNAEPDEERDEPGTEAYYQIRSDESRRLTGLVYEEVFRALSAYDVTFAADLDAGAKYRLSDDGRDYYGVIRRSFDADVVATLLEAAFISNPDEEALLRRPDVRQAEADAVVRAVRRYFAGDEPGDVFTEPYPRTTPAGPGGGREGCEDPA